LPLYPDEPEIHRHIGIRQFYYLHEPSKALPHFQKALSLDETDAYTLANIGKCCRALGDLVSAGSYLAKAAAYDQSNVHLEALIEVLIMQGDLAGAAQKCKLGEGYVVVSGTDTHRPIAFLQGIIFFLQQNEDDAKRAFIRSLTPVSRAEKTVKSLALPRETELRLLRFVVETLITA
jgi:tetratricopeptide (TPR) repeat protein